MNARIAALWIALTVVMILAAYDQIFGSTPVTRGNPLTIDKPTVNGHLAAPVIIDVDRRMATPNGEITVELALLKSKEKLMGVDLLPKDVKAPAVVSFGHSAVADEYPLIVKLDLQHPELQRNIYYEGHVVVTYFRKQGDPETVAYDIHYVIVTTGPLPPLFTPGAGR